MGVSDAQEPAVVQLCEVRLQLPPVQWLSAVQSTHLPAMHLSAEQPVQDTVQVAP
jgi:hypothetical protein